MEPKTHHVLQVQRVGSYGSGMPNTIRLSGTPRVKLQCGGEQSCSPPMEGDPTAQRTSSSGCEAKSTVKMNSPADQYHNPDPLVRLIGKKNESIVQVENQEVTALIDPGAQI